MKITQAIKGMIPVIPNQMPSAGRWIKQHATANSATRTSPDAIGVLGKASGTTVAGSARGLRAWIDGAQTDAEAELGAALYHLTTQNDPVYLRLVEENERAYEESVGPVSIDDVHLVWHPTVQGKTKEHACTLTLTVYLRPLELQTTRERWPGTAIVDVKASGGYETVKQMDADLQHARDLIWGGHHMPTRYREDEVMRDARACALEIARIALGSLPSSLELKADNVCLRNHALVHNG